MSVFYDTAISADENLLSTTDLGSEDILLPSGVVKADVTQGRLPYSFGPSRNCTRRYIEAGNRNVIHVIV